MNILVLGTGGREHAIAWKISESPNCDKVFLHPGNAGTEVSGIPNFGNVPVEIEPLLKACAQHDIKLIVIGPEAYLARGFADEFRERGFLVVGPSRHDAQLETSKVFAKRWMWKARVPTAPAEIFDSSEALLAYNPPSWPEVFKYDGLAAGKGVVVAQNKAEQEEFVKRVWEDEEFGKGPHHVLSERCIVGTEISYLGFCDGKRFVPMTSATDFKRVGVGDIGPNTGGMGVVSPSPYITPDLEDKIQKRIIVPVLEQMERDNMNFRGILFIGLMIDNHGEPHVLEFNTRFGDPETQAILLRMNSDLLKILLATAESKLAEIKEIDWTSNTAVYVVGCSNGYPQNVRTGDVIIGIEAHSPEPDVKIFFSGVKRENGKLVTAGGRVLGVGALGNGVDTARKTAYKILQKISWSGMHYRTDIGETKCH